MTLLSLVTYFCNRNGIPAPTTVIGNTDPDVLQILRLLEEEGNDLALRYNWNVLTVEAHLTTIASEIQGSLTGLMPSSYRYIINDTIWDRSTRLPIFPVDPADWEAIKATISSVQPYRYLIYDGNINVTPIPPAGLEWYWMYQSSAWILKADNSRYRYFEDDTDTMLLPDDLLLAGLRWRWLREKGLEYAELFATYEKMATQYMSTDRPRARLNMSPDMSNAPGIYVPAGSWISP